MAEGQTLRPHSHLSLLIVLVPACLSLLGCVGWLTGPCAHWLLFVLTAACSCSSPFICWSLFVPACLSLLSYTGQPLCSSLLICAHHRSFMLVSVHLLAPICPCLFVSAWLCLFGFHSHLFVLWWVSFGAPQPLICICIKYIVSTYIINKLTFIPWIINLYKNYWLIFDT